MKSLLFSLGRAFFLLIPFYLISCDGCQNKIGPWLDEHTVEIPKEDNTPPIAWFEITDGKSGETIKVEKDTSMRRENGSHLSIVFFGKDDESGIKKLCYTGGSRQECCSTNLNPRLCSVTQPISGVICTEMPDFGENAFISWFMITEIPISMNCDANWELVSGTYGLTGTVTNSMDVQTNISLTIIVEE